MRITRKIWNTKLLEHLLWQVLESIMLVSKTICTDTAINRQVEYAQANLRLHKKTVCKDNARNQWVKDEVLTKWRWENLLAICNLTLLVYCCLVTKTSLTLLWPQGLWPTRVLCPRGFPSKNTGVGCHFLL